MDTLSRMSAIFGLLGMALLCMAAQPAKSTRSVQQVLTPQAAPLQDAKDSLGMTKAMHDRLNAINKNKSATGKQLRDGLNAAIEDLRGKVDAIASDNDITASFSNIKTDMKSIGDADLFYWDSLAAFLTPPQVAALFLKSHPPRNQSPVPASAVTKSQTPKAPENAAAHQPSNVMSGKDWKAYIALTQDQQNQLNAANKAKGTTLNPLRANRDNDIETLRTKVNMHSSDIDIQAVFTAVISDLKAISNVENGYWDTVAAFLSPLQVAKLFLRGRPKK